MMRRICEIGNKAKLQNLIPDHEFFKTDFKIVDSLSRYSNDMREKYNIKVRSRKLPSIL